MQSPLPPAPARSTGSRFARFWAGACLAFAVFALPPALFSQQAPQFSALFVFGDSLSDTGDRADRSVDQYNLRFPAPFFNYTFNRYTSGPDTRPASLTFKGVWHEQLEKTFLGIKKARPSLEGGTSYAFGDGRTSQGTHESVIAGISPLVGRTYSVTIDDMGKQVNDYLSDAGGKADPKALFILWGGNNDLASVNPSPAGVQAAVTNEVGLVQQLALAGARNFLIVNVPPLGSTPVVIANGPAAAAGLNQLSAGFRTGLSGGLAQLQGGLRASGINLTIYQVDAFAVLADAVQNPAAYGFASVTTAAQASPNPSKDDADRYLFWDGFHPTAAGHYQAAAEAFGVLSGASVVQVFAGGSLASGQIVGGPTGGFVFYFTRTGENLGADLKVNYSQKNGAAASVTIPAGARSVALSVGNSKQTIKLEEGNGYVRGARASAKNR